MSQQVGDHGWYTSKRARRLPQNRPGDRHRPMQVLTREKRDVCPWIFVDKISTHLWGSRDTVYKWIDRKGMLAPPSRSKAAPVWLGRGDDQRIPLDGSSCLIVFRNHPTFTMEHFAHDRLCELLRSALAFGVSAMDRYFHDIICDRLFDMIKRPKTDIPKALANFSIFLLDSEDALAHAL